ncbi:hypothetical protein CDA63_15955 [Hymenobacter amundsenii]|uniref:Uncharacterized protein n=1 Tax=Hymenobacter amundsenii TaxID=2006685 RepID=A0A246FHR4_9BACT|nr:hypothetical protein CDA63_15955 [Hymenobacter amundsenii]
MVAESPVGGHDVSQLIAQATADCRIKSAAQFCGRVGYKVGERELAAGAQIKREMVGLQLRKALIVVLKLYRQQEILIEKHSIGPASEAITSGIPLLLLRIIATFARHPVELLAGTGRRIT